MNVIEFVLVIVFFVVICVLVIGLDSRCPECKKMFALKKVSSELVSSTLTTIDVDREVKDNDGKVVYHYTEAVPATKDVYDCVYECKYCGHSCNKIQSITNRN